MSYKVSVPLTRFTAEDRDAALDELERLGASRVFLCPGRGLDSPEEKLSQLRQIEDGLRFFTQHGYETGVWISTIGHGGSLIGATGANSANFIRLKSLEGVEQEGCFCPLDESFSSAVCSWVADLARAGARMIMLDDDYRLSNRGGSACMCEAHLAEFRRRVGENIPLEEAAAKIWRGGENKYRDALLGMKGDTLRRFSRALREAVDRVDETVRLGACACMSVWDGDGVDSIEISRILAGNTEPFMRFIGAPYWAKNPGLTCFAKRLGYVAELERMQEFWCRGSGVEIMSEGDVYPRPRYMVPAAYLEGFDTVLRASGGFDGILKYGIDYTSSPTYETGYARLAERNRPLYDEIDRHFSGKRAVGLTVAAAMNKLSHKEFSDKILNSDRYSDYSFFQPEQALLCDCGIPMSYDGSEITVCFGENAKYLTESQRRGALILDVPAALILRDSGLDTGLLSASSLDVHPSFEYFPDYGERVVSGSSEGLFRVTVNANAKILSEFDIGTNIPSVYRFENASGQHIAVICADMSLARNNESLRRSYCRSRQMAELLRLMRPDFPALCPGHPDLYMLAKDGGDSLSVGLWNFFEDPVFSPEITLGGRYSRAEFINCSGTLDGSKVTLHGEIAPFAFAGFEVFRF